MTDTPLFAAGTPTIIDVRAWTGVPANVLTDAQCQAILDAELTLQAMYCDVPTDYPKTLWQAALRRCAREIAARGLPLGLTAGDVEYGPIRYPMIDPEIERLEGPYRLIPVA